MSFQQAAFLERSQRHNVMKKRNISTNGLGCRHNDVEGKSLFLYLWLLKDLVCVHINKIKAVTEKKKKYKTKLKIIIKVISSNASI